jgi:hypothetical protein
VTTTSFWHESDGLDACFTVDEIIVI